MGCVNKSSKEFKNLAAKHNLASNTLELITHKYWVETGNETLFPTDVYIQAQLGNTQYQEDGKSVRKLWERDYSSSKEFDSIKELEAAKREAAKYFPKAAIVAYRNAKDNLVLSVKRPVEKINNNKDDFFNDYDNIGSMKDIKKLNLDIEKNTAYTIDKVQSLYDRFNDDRTSKALADKVFSIAKDLGIEVTFDESLPLGTVGRYLNSNKIIFRKSFLERDTMTNKKAPILLHEVIHAVTMYALSDTTKNWKVSKDLEEFRTEINSLYQDLKTHPMLKGERGITDWKEFVAELANPVFRAKIKEIDKQNKKNRSFWSRILDAFKSLFGIHVSSNYYQRSMNALDKALDAFDIDTYMRYNGIKSKLREGYNAKEWNFNSMSEKELKDKVAEYIDENQYTSEMLAIKEETIANGTFMKAPNGKNTNLTERQWLQVRTKTFKEWFGDWEKEYTPPRQWDLSTWERTGEYVDVLGKDFLGNTYSTSEEILSHPVERKETTKEDPFGFNSTGVSKAIKVGTLVNKSNPLNGICQYTAQRVEAFLKDRYGIEVHSNIIDAKSPVTGKTITHHVVALSIDGKPYIYDMPQTEFISINGNTFNVGNKEYKEAVITKEYSPRLIEITEESLLKNYGDSNNTQISVIKDTAKLSGNIKSSDIEANYIPAYSSDVSKVVDENGEPLVVYHYTDNENLTEFSIEFDNFFSKTGGTKNAIFFTTDNVVPGSEDNFLTSRKAKLSLFLNIKNLEVFHGTKDGLHKQGTSYREIVNKSSKRKGSENGIVLTDFDDNKKENQTIYVVHNPNQIKSATDNVGTFSRTNDGIANYELTKEFTSSMPEKDLKDELSLIKQESADYNLINNIEEEKNHSGKAVPQDFTFNDGTVVKAPFRPNAQQIDALNAISDFMKSNETSMTLSGYAGTGKTSLMEMIAKKGLQQYKRVAFCATTNKAAAVLNERVSKAGFKATTLNKMFGIGVEVDKSSKSYNARNLVNHLKEAEIAPGTTVIIDEASMINEENYGILNNIAKEMHLKIIYVGDEAQLAPVNEKDTSKVFRNGDGKVIRLTQVERTDDNAILKEATDIRNGKPLSGESSFNNKGEGVAYISPQHQDAIDEVINHYIKGLKRDPNHFRILAYSNKAVSEYNNKVRSLLGYNSPIPQVGEPMTGYNNWGYEWRKKTYRFINSEAYKVIKTDKPKVVSTRLDDGTMIAMEAIPITLEDSLGNVDTFNFMDIKNNPQNRQAATALAYEKKRLWAKAKKTLGKDAKAEVHAKINAIDGFLFVNDNLEDNNHNLLQAKTIDFGYAMTVHKSQGSTFANVLIDDVDIVRGSFKPTISNSIEMVELGDVDTNVPSMDNLKSVSSVIDLGFDSEGMVVDNSNTNAISNTDVNTATQTSNLRQQLEYVGVSRATDTVTIISNNVKKEGSPLHPEKNIKEDIIKDNNQRSNSSITQQLVDHLKSIPGVKVFDRTAMEEFVKTHNLQYLQRMTTPQGEVYGFVDKDGNIYLDETKISPEHPIHEYTHLWDRAVQKRNPQLWQRGIELMKKTSLWNDILNDEHYGKVWQSMNLSNEKLDSLIASEAHSRLVGENGEKLLNNLAKNKGEEGIISKLKQWILDMWKEVKTTFGSWSKEDLDALTLKDFNHMTVRDFAEGINLNDVTENKVNANTSPVTKIISGGQTGVDTIGLQVAKKLGIETGGKAPRGFLREKGIDNEDIASYGLIEISNEEQVDYTNRKGKSDPYTGRTELNVRNSDGTVYFATSEDSAGKLATERSAKEWNKPFLLNPTAEELRKWIDANNIQTLNVAGNRGSKLPANNNIASIIEKALTLHTDNITYTPKGKTTPAFYEGNIKPDANTIFVFGSSPEGRHGAGAAKIAKEQFGAQYGVGEGLTGNAYALPTKDLLVKFEAFEDDPSTQPLKENAHDIYFDIRKGTSGNPISLLIKNIKDGKVTYVEEQWITNKDGFRDKVENPSTKKTVTEAEFREITGRDKPSFTYSNSYGFADVWYTGKKTTDGHAIYSIEISIPDDENQGKGIGSKMYEDIIDKLAAQGDYITPGLVAANNHKWESLQKKGRIKEVTLQNGESAFIALPKNKPVPNRNYQLRSISEKTITENIRRMYDVARQNPNKQFKVAYRNTDAASLNGYTGLEMIEMFKAAGTIPSNVVFSKEWIDTGLITKDDYSNEAEPADTLNLEEGQSQRVSLPSYEYFNDLYEDTPVDAEWKVSYLKELDAQINSEKSLEENKNIIDKMNTVLQATSEEEYKQELANSKKNKVDTKISEYDKLNKQIDTLLEGKEYEDGLVETISATEIRHIGELIGNQISDIITELQKEKGLAQKLFPSLNTNLDFQTATRKQIVETVNINRLIQRAKSLFSPENGQYDDIDTIYQAAVIIDNWDAIMVLAADAFAFNEGFGISKNYSEGNWKTKERAVLDYDNFNDYSNDEDIAAEEGAKDEQEKWQIEMRTIDVLTSMSALVRQGIHECYLLDKDGNKVMSKWNIPERVNPRIATNSILRWTQGSLSFDDMITKLSEKQMQNPWLSQLIARFSDKSGKETDFQSQFYGVFQKHFQQYSIVLSENGKYHSMIVNSYPARKEAMNSIESKFRIGDHPLFGKNGKINAQVLDEIQKSYEHIQEVNQALKKGEELSEEMYNAVMNDVLSLCKNLGFEVPETLIVDAINAETIDDFDEYLSYMTTSLYKALEKQRKGTMKNYDPFKFKGEDNIGNALKKFLTIITEKMEDTAVSAFYDSGKMYQSYVTPSFMTNLFSKFKQKGKALEEFVMEEYGSSSWFRFNPEDPDIHKGWRNRWLFQLAVDENARKVFDHKVELNFNKHNYMRSMKDPEYALSMITEYFAESTATEDMTPSWYRVPMQSNKPSSEFIKFYSYRGIDYKDSIVMDLYDMFLQEISRIQTVRMRNKSKNDAGFIKNFDTNGRKFCFLPVFNAYLENDAASVAKRTVLRNENGRTSSDNNKFADLLQKKIDGKAEMTSEEDTELNNLAEKILYQYMEDRVNSILDNWERSGILEAAKSIRDIYPSEFKEEDATKYVRKQVENFLWNDALASKNILQLTLTDIAFYKDTEDLQKRLAQLHAPGTRGRNDATDYEGNRVSDGRYRTFVLTDFDSFKSNIIANISEVFDRKIANAPDNQKAAMKALKESLVGKDGKYTKINVTDAQGYSSPSSYRKKALRFGKWSREAEAIYQKLVKGEYTYTDLETAFQPLKPFVYSKLTKNMGVENAPVNNMKVPFQAKNSEYLLIMADAILKGEELSRPNLLRAVYRVMEDSEKLMPTKGIDTVQFESAIKSGLQGKMNIFQFRDMAGGEEAAYTYMMNQIFKEEYDANTGERVYKNYDTDTFVHETSYDDYCLQQEVPEHFKQHSQSHGSQIRMITPSDLDFFTTDENGNQVDNYYEWTEPDGTHRKVKADEFREEYEETIAESIEESINDLSRELHLDSQSKVERNIALSEILQAEILSSPRYGIDLMQACSVDKETGEFRIPKGDPIQAKRIEQLINSLIKNKVNKQKIAGGPIVQVSNFGTSQQLHIRFNDKKGNLIPLEEEYNPSEHGNLSYEDYLKKNQGGIAYFEVYAPIWSNEIFEMFANPDGTINVEAINAVNPELLKMVSYRIPTEDKYSCAPMKVVGFMPREAGDAIMFPYELTEIDDSDFDIDKRYVMRKDISLRKRNLEDFIEELEKKGIELYKKHFKTEPAKNYIYNLISNMDKTPWKFDRSNDFRKELYSEYIKASTYTDTPLSGRKYRDNKVVDMTYAVLTNEMTADKILNPGGFDAPKKMGYMVAAYKNSTNNVSWNALQGMSIDDLKKLSYTDKDLTFADTQVQFYKQNAAASSLIGVFAVNKVAHASLEGNDIFLAVSEICGDYDFTIAGTTFGGRMQIDKKHDSEGNLIGKTLGSLVSASADAVKDPILNLMNINMTTAGMLNTMLRLGMTFNDAALFLSQNVIERVIDQFNIENLTGYATLDSIVNKMITDYQDKYTISDDSHINTEPLTKEELIEGLKDTSHEAIDYKVLLAFQKLKGLTTAMRNITFITRFNSISSAVGPLIVDNLIIEHKVEQFLSENNENGTHFYKEDGTIVDANTIFDEHPILKQFYRTVGMAKSMFLDMPAGSNGFRNLLYALPEDIANKMYGDKKLLDQFSNFYQSYLLVQSGVINPKHLHQYIANFPKWFVEQNFKEKYHNNELIQAISLKFSKYSENPYLMINITGMDEQRKEELKSAWIDLHKEDPKLSKMLFDYSFFRAGVGFSPKTLMALVPTYVKERLKNDKNGASYLDTYRKFPDVAKGLVIDQFIRNNWDNNKLVPLKGGKDSHYNIDVRHGLLTVYRSEEIADLAGITYIKTKVGKNTYLWQYKGKQGTGEIVFKLIKPLGNNGEYLEMSTEDIVNPMTETTKSIENNDASNLKTMSPEESNAEESVKPTVSKTETAKNLDYLIDLVMSQNKSVGREISRDEALKRVGNIKNYPERFGDFLVNAFKNQGIILDKEKAIEKFKEFC